MSDALRGWIDQLREWEMPSWLLAMIVFMVIALTVWVATAIAGFIGAVAMIAVIGIAMMKVDDLTPP